MLALIKNTFLKKIFLQCSSLSSMLLKTFFSSFFLNKIFLCLPMNLDGVSSHIRHLLWTVLHASIPSSSPGPEEATGRYDRPIRSDPAKRKTTKKKKKKKTKQKKRKTLSSHCVLSYSFPGTPPHDLLQLNFASWLSLGKDVSFKHSYM